MGALPKATAALTVLLTVALAALEPIDAPMPLRLVVALGLGVGGFILGVRDPIMAVVLLGGPALLGPAARLETGGLNLNAGDAYLGGSFLGLMLGGHLRFPAPTLTRRLLIAAMPFILVGWILSREPASLAPSLVGLVQLAVVYAITVAVIRTEADTWRLMSGWLFGVTLSSVLVVVAYRMGIPLLVGADTQYAEGYGELLQSETTLYRATFFITGFIFPLAISLVGAVATMLARPTSLRTTAALLAATVINLTAAVLMGNMTAVVAVGMTMGLAWIGSIVLLRRIGAAVAALAVAVAGAIGGVAIVSQIMSPAQFLLLVARTGQSESFQLRLGVWTNIWNHLMEMPATIFIGLGPDYTTRMVTDPLVQQLFFAQGVQQHAVDSGYLYGVLNYGFPAAILLLLAVSGVTLSLLVRVALREPESAICFVMMSALVVWLIMAISQQHGVAKPVFALAQLVAVGELLAWRRREAGFAPRAAIGFPPEIATP